MRGGCQMPVGDHGAALIHADASPVQAKPVGDRRAARRYQQVRGRHLGGVTVAEEDAAVVWA